jgi:hypothetical protein
MLNVLVDEVVERDRGRGIADVDEDFKGFYSE